MNTQGYIEGPYLNNQPKLTSQPQPLQQCAPWSRVLVFYTLSTQPGLWSRKVSGRVSHLVSTLPNKQSTPPYEVWVLKPMWQRRECLHEGVARSGQQAERPFYKTVKVKPRLQWRSQDVSDVRTVRTPDKDSCTRSESSPRDFPDVNSQISISAPCPLLAAVPTTVIDSYPSRTIGPNKHNSVIIKKRRIHIGKNHLIK